VTRFATVSGHAVYRFGQPMVPDVPATLVKVADLELTDCGAPLTGGDIHPGGERLLLRSRAQVCELRLAPGLPFEAIFAGPAVAVPTRLKGQGEAVAYTADGRGYVTTHEGVGASLTQVRCAPTTDGGAPDGGPVVDASADAGSCGNGELDPGELCDGLEVGLDSCEARGFRRGTLRCAPDCAAIDENGCSNVRINEVEGNPNPDWIELYNPGPSAADLSGYFFTDNVADDPTHRYTFASGALIPAGGYLVLTNGPDFTFGLGAPDFVRLYAPDGTLIDELAWDVHGVGTYARCPDGADTVVDVAVPTSGASNASSCP
jgi:hypothetical protein